MAPTGRGRGGLQSVAVTSPPTPHFVPLAPCNAPLPSIRAHRRCDRRCEATTAVEPPGYPVMGFYCMMHGYQKPRQSPDGGLEIATEVEQHLRRRTSFVAPESNIAAEMAKSVGLVRDRPGQPRAAAGNSLLQWLMERKGLDEDAAMEMGARLVALECLQPLAGAPAKGFSADKTALYRVVPQGQPKGPTA
jgi:hypothetical protein